MSRFLSLMIWIFFLKKIHGLLNLASEEEELDNQETLSQREKEIVICVVKGMTNKEIAENLFLSIHTVITHRRNISKSYRYTVRLA